MSDAARQAAQAGSDSLKSRTCVICSADGTETRAVITCVYVVSRPTVKHKLNVKEETGGISKKRVEGTVFRGSQTSKDKSSFGRRCGNDQ